MKRRLTWGLLYALIVTAICLSTWWSPALLLIAFIGSLREVLVMKALTAMVKLRTTLYLLSSAFATFFLWTHDDWSDIHSGGEVLLWIFILVWLSDSMAYIGGRWFGKTPLAPTLSPKKTWEGAIIGWLFTSLLGAVLLLWQMDALAQWSLPNSWPELAWKLPLIVGFAAPIGDLIASKIKRLAGVKDSGVFLPAHGGFLDRFDSFILASLIVGLLIT
ncbi:MAG: phosphatidate cytidylyltransferase [Flavobacteriales bacterium]|jgi:phosphatidate cytidylyltransferase|nr:phosphatidate cytidylyltransferase [Flavobacteriales bacterium]MBT3740282.1 phosphatidate cytidylyltransferase [Flavobacteriales bacterium]MBT4102679.1 phosphatidate cytidylyltransferase [Flavobacteriales bacterium]MBT4202003.1 phosphatidate cytidylyltransferase [Flavobacteriales bacterium]MBT4529320.1 phosphatidate cytidylyltransferase [Flavobacteriales bacterium]